MTCHNPFCNKPLPKVLTTTVRFFCDEYCAFIRMKIRNEGNDKAKEWWDGYKERVNKAFQKFTPKREANNDTRRIRKSNGKRTKGKGRKRTKKVV